MYSIPFVESRCPNECNGNGQCDLSTGLCNCDDKHQGLDCSGNIKSYILGNKSSLTFKNSLIWNFFRIKMSK